MAPYFFIFYLFFLKLYYFVPITIMQDAMSLFFLNSMGLRFFFYYYYKMVFQSIVVIIFYLKNILK
jgi:hypothetical protein